MNISKKLLIIVCLTVTEVSLTVWAAFEISNGARFHQLNFLHLKYAGQFSELLSKAESDGKIDVLELEEAILLVEQQPMDCLKQVTVLDKFVMRQIGTYQVIEICENDIQIARDAIYSLDRYMDGLISQQQLLGDLHIASRGFSEHSTQFEEPVTKTVSFILRTMIPMVIFISLFNIVFITYLSRTISSSIKGFIKLLSASSPEASDTETQLENQVSGELSELLVVAKKRIEKDFLNIETNLELQKIIQNRTASLQQANDELEQFAYRASHDLKSPLSASKGLATYVLKDIEAGEIQEAKNNVERIYRQLDKLETLVVDILSLTKADLGAEENVPVDFNELFDSIKENLTWLTEQRQCDISMNATLSEPVFSQKTRLAQVLENLISNGIKYMNPEETHPRVVLTVSDNSKHLLIRVTDNGLGIPENKHENIFDKFSRFHPNVHSGSGLGLSIVKKHIDYLNGTINFNSSRNGSTFDITIPKFSQEIL